MFLDGKAALHIVDTATYLSTATLFNSNGESYGQTADGLWQAFFIAWAPCILAIQTDFAQIKDHNSLPKGGNRSLIWLE